MDASPSSSRSLPITNSFSKMVSGVPSTPPSGSEPACSPLPLQARPLLCTLRRPVSSITLGGLQPRPSLCLFKDVSAGSPHIYAFSQPPFPI